MNFRELVHKDGTVYMAAVNLTGEELGIMTCKVMEEEILESKYTILLSVQKNIRTMESFVGNISFCYLFLVVHYGEMPGGDPAACRSSGDVAELHKGGTGDELEDHPIPSKLTRR